MPWNREGALKQGWSANIHPYRDIETGRRISAFSFRTDPQGSHQKRPTVVTSKPANGSGLGLGCFTPPPPEEASLFSYANSVDRI